MKRPMVVVAVALVVTAAAAGGWWAAWRVWGEVGAVVGVVAPNVVVDQMTGEVAVPACAAIGPCTTATAWREGEAVPVDLGLSVEAWAALVEVAGPEVEPGEVIAGVSPVVVEVVALRGNEVVVRFARDFWTLDGTAGTEVGSVYPARYRSLG